MMWICEPFVAHISTHKSNIVCFIYFPIIHIVHHLYRKNEYENEMQLYGKIKPGVMIFYWENEGKKTPMKTNINDNDDDNDVDDYHSKLQSRK